MPATTTALQAVYTVIYNLKDASSPDVPPASSVLLAYQPAKQRTLMVDVQESLYFGRTRPVAEYGQAFYRVWALTFFLPFWDPNVVTVPGGQYADWTFGTDNPGWLGVPTITLLENIITNQQVYGYASVIKDPTGTTYVGHIGNLVVARVAPKSYSVQLTFSEVDTDLTT